MKARAPGCFCSVPFLIALKPVDRILNTQWLISAGKTPPQRFRLPFITSSLRDAIFHDSE